MCLALIVRETTNPQVSKLDCDRLFFFVGAIAMITLLVNATTSKLVLTQLRLIGDNAFEKLVIMTQIRKRLRGEIRNTV